MLGYIPVIFLQCIGVLIPIAGIIILIKKGQGNATPFLIMANFGALVMNLAYLFLLRSSNYQEVLSIYKFEYLGNAIFYIVFVLYLKAFFLKNKKSKIFSVMFILFMFIEIGTMWAVIMDSSYGLENLSVQYREDDGKLYTQMSKEDKPEPGSEQTEKPDDTANLSEDVPLAEDEKPSEDIAPPENDQSVEEAPPELPEDAAVTESTVDTDAQDNTDTVQSDDSDFLISIDEGNSLSTDIGKGYIYVKAVQGKMMEIRYAYLAFVLFIALVASICKAVCNKQKSERRKMIYITMAECVVLIALIISLTLDPSYDVVPILTSVSVLSIICGTANGDLFTITDRGRGWVLDHSDNIFFIVDENFRFLDANNYAKEEFPLVAGKNTNCPLPEDLKTQLLSDSSELVMGDKTYAKKMAPIIIGKKTVGYSIMLMDMTAHYKLMAQVEEEKQKAIDANEAKSNFMSNMSHEIRTPMNAIVGMTELMLRRDQDAINTEYLNNIKNSGNALLTVINDILDFSKIESGKLEIIPDEYEMMSVLNDLSMIFLNRIGEKPIELIYDIDPKLPNKLKGDMGRVRQVLTNIVNNGIKYTDEGYVKLIMRYEKKEGTKAVIYCDVEDSGIGIKEEDLTKLFSTFSQVDTKKNRGKEGTGLGLSIAKQLVEAMGGTISVTSTYGKGSIFSFSFEQEVLEDTPAANINEVNDIYVSGKLSYSLSQEMLKKLCGYYEHVNYIDIMDAVNQDQKIDFFFMECDSMKEETCPAEIRSYVEQYKPELILIHNPMLEGAESDGITVMNKPLYTLNFCLAINHEVLSFQEQQEQLMSFKAPEASILLVDDNEMNRKVALGLMEPLAMKVDTAADGKQAVEMVKANQYDIVFMDHMMPIMDGIEATAAIRAMEGDYYKNLPIIALSANALAEAREQFKAVGMNDFLAKPIKTKDLFKRILKFLPENKIQKCGTIVAEETKVNTEELPAIEGLDVAAGMENSGGAKLFYSLLGDFYRLIDRKATKIEKCLADNMIHDYTIEVHALKNTARMIGALELSDEFYTLEKAGNAEDMDIINTRTVPTLEHFRSYKPILAPYAASDNENKETISNDEIVAILDTLKEAIDGFDLDAADAAMKKLEGAQMPEEIRAMVGDLGDLLADVAMEEVMTLCDQIRAKLTEL